MTYIHIHGDLLPILHGNMKHISSATIFTPQLRWTLSGAGTVKPKVGRIAPPKREINTRHPTIQPSQHPIPSRNRLISNTKPSFEITKLFEKYINIYTYILMHTYNAISHMKTVLCYVVIWGRRMDTSETLHWQMAKHACMPSDPDNRSIQPPP